jgi:hypothetical protein
VSLFWNDQKEQTLAPVADNTIVALPPPTLTFDAPELQAADKGGPGGAQPQPDAKQILPPIQPGIYHVNPANIPASLRKLPNWVHWRLEKSDKGKPTKVPYIAGTLIKAGSTTPSTWRPFELAATLLTSECGLGFVLPLQGDIFVVDLDHVRNAKTGDIALWAERLIGHLNTYTEVSPSRTGLHIIGCVKGPIPTEGRKKGSIEFYTRGRYITITGDRHV